MLWSFFITDVLSILIAGFLSIPTSVNATLGSTATFNCSATTGVIDWLVNGSPLTELSTPYITVSSNGRTSFLRVPVSLEYNDTVVVCEVTVHDPIPHNESSASAVLRVQGMLCIVKRQYMQYSPLIVMNQMTCLII